MSVSKRQQPPKRGLLSSLQRFYCILNLSDPPDPPSDLDYNDGVVIESSVDLQWTRPFYTGGVDVMSYTVSANGRRLEVMDDSETVSYTTSGLVYGEVQVSAINTCGQESQLSTINIPAEGNVCDIPLPFLSLEIQPAHPHFSYCTELWFCIAIVLFMFCKTNSAKNFS